MKLHKCSDLYYVFPAAAASSLWHIDDLLLAGKYVRPQVQFVVVLASQDSRMVASWHRHRLCGKA